jgi:hypothetical protein
MPPVSAYGEAWGANTIVYKPRSILSEFVRAEALGLVDKEKGDTPKAVRSGRLRHKTAKSGPKKSKPITTGKKDKQAITTTAVAGQHDGTEETKSDGTPTAPTLVDDKTTTGMGIALDDEGEIVIDPCQEMIRQVHIMHAPEHELTGTMNDAGAIASNMIDTDGKWYVEESWKSKTLRDKLEMVDKCADNIGLSTVEQAVDVVESERGVPHWNHTKTKMLQYNALIKSASRTEDESVKKKAAMMSSFRKSALAEVLLKDLDKAVSLDTVTGERNHSKRLFYTGTNGAPCRPAEKLRDTLTSDDMIIAKMVAEGQDPTMVMAASSSIMALYASVMGNEVLELGLILSAGDPDQMQGNGVVYGMIYLLSVLWMENEDRSSYRTLLGMLEALQAGQEDDDDEFVFDDEDDDNDDGGEDGFE